MRNRIDEDRLFAGCNLIIVYLFRKSMEQKSLV